MANGLGGLVVTRSLSEKTIAGQTLDVTLTLVKQNDVRVNALYLAETLPSEWTLNQVLESSGHYSSLGPANGVSGTLKFIWVEMPDFPCTVTYRVNVPSSEAGTCSFEGEIGWAETSDPVYSSTGGDLSVEVEPVEQQVATPVISPTNGTVFTTSSKRVTITCATNGAEVRFTTNGVDPTASSALYSSSFNIYATTTVKARAFKSGLTDSEIAVATITKPIVITLSDALDVPDWTVTTGGDGSWTPEIADTHDGADAARTGAIGASQTTWMETSVSGAGTLTFWWRASCEDSPDDDWDYLTFTVDGVEQARVDGDSGWRQVSASLASGNHTLRWTYSKDDADETVNEDCGWVDQIVWTPVSASTTTTEVPVPYAWLDQFSLVTGGNYEAAAMADADGDGHLTWQEYVAGTVPTNSASVFTASIMLSNGVRYVTWTPNLGTERVYTVEGKSSLTNAAWVSSTNAASRFFRVKVSPK